jgi:hypothetical protein
MQKHGSKSALLVTPGNPAVLALTGRQRKALGVHIVTGLHRVVVTCKSMLLRFASADISCGSCLIRCHRPAPCLHSTNIVLSDAA